MLLLSKPLENAYRLVARPFVSIFKLLRVSANLVTLLGLALGVGVGYLIYEGRLWSAVVLFFLMMVLDHADGMLARATGTASPFGGFLDGVVDRVRTPIFLVAVSGYLFRAAGDAYWLYLGFAVNSVILLNGLVYMQGAKLDADKAGKERIKSEQRFDRGPRQAAVAIMNLDLTDWVINSVLLIVFLAADRLDLYLWITLAFGGYALLMKVLRQYLLQRMLRKATN